MVLNQYHDTLKKQQSLPGQQKMERGYD